MAVVGHRDLDQLAAALMPWLHQRLPEATAIVLPRPSPPEAGGSSETLFLEPQITTRGGTRKESWVLRIEASANQIYQDASIERQVLALRTLALTSEVPVPRVLWFEPDHAVIGQPFFVMERVVGAIPDSFHHSKGLLFDSSPEQREALWTEAFRTMARIHVADPLDFAFLARPELGTSGLEQEIAVWDRYLDWAHIPVRPIQRSARQWLADHLPQTLPTGLAWGDARPGNMIFDQGRCVAVIDWETVSLAGAETDLGWWLFYDWFMSDGFGVARLEGLPGRHEAIRLWEEFAGRRAEAMEWHEVFATWRFSLISDRARMLMRRRGEIDPLADDPETPHARRLAMLIGS